MRLERIELENFRSYGKQTFHFGQLTVIVAPNGRGKTNLLEAISLLSTGDSSRANLTEEMIAWDKELASVTGIVDLASGDVVALTVVLTRGTLLGKRTQKRRYLVDGAPRTRGTFTGRLPTVMFRPEDMRLVEGNPGRRRQYLDDILASAHPDYARALTAYEASLRRRNRILDMIREGTARREQLSYWDLSVVKNGNVLTDYRRGYLEYLSGVQTAFGQYQTQYNASTISPARLTEHAEAEVAVGHTLVGPHKDDFTIISNPKFSNSQTGAQGKNLMIYGSRGEQRLGVLYLKLGALRYMEEKVKLQPLLLLDDIFSELDEEHRQEVVKMTVGRQAILTSAEEETVELVPGAEVIRL